MNRLIFSPKKTVVMGVLNVTPDSFSDGGKWLSQEDCLVHVKQMIAEGVDVIDIGGESTRPGSTPIDLNTELQRVLPVIQAIRAEIGNDVCLSLDTYKAEVARQGLAAGVDVINDVSGLRFDSDMPTVVAAAGCQLIINHIFGQPTSMQQTIPERTDVVAEVIRDLLQSVEKAQAAGVAAENLILDPGFGFGKTYQENLIMLNQLNRVVELGYPVMAGVSRKRVTGLTIQRRTGTAQEPAATERLGSSVAAHVLAAHAGVAMIRVHDVLAHVQAMAMVDAVKEQRA